MGFDGSSGVFQSTSSQLQGIDETKNIRIKPIPSLLQTQQAPALPLSKLAGRPDTENYTAKGAKEFSQKS